MRSISEHSRYHNPLEHRVTASHLSVGCDREKRPAGASQSGAHLCGRRRRRTLAERRRKMRDSVRGEMKREWWAEAAENKGGCGKKKGCD